jgi:hypothetical protein
LEFAFVFDDSQDVATYSELLRTMSSIPIRTLESKKRFALPVGEVFKGLGMTANTDYYEADEMFEFGDNDNNYFANEMSQKDNEEEDKDGVE